MIVIDMTLEEVKKHIADAWQEKQLGIQNSPGSPCYYEYSTGHVCAVGAILTKDQRQDLRVCGRNSRGFGSLIVDEAVSVLDNEVETFLYAVQHRHDSGDLEKFRQFLVDTRVPIYG